MDSGNPKILAFNSAGVSTCYSKSVLIVNLSNHRFSIKYGRGETPNSTLVAAGIGGYDRTTGKANPGYY